MSPGHAPFVILHYFRREKVTSAKDGVGETSALRGFHPLRVATPERAGFVIKPRDARKPTGPGEPETIARDWPLELNRTGSELNYRQRCLRTSLYCCRLHWKVQSCRRAAGGRWHGHNFCLLRRSRFALSASRRPLFVCALCLWNRHGHPDGMDASPCPDCGARGQCQFICNFSRRVLAARSRSLAARAHSYSSD